MKVDKTKYKTILKTRKALVPPTGSTFVNKGTCRPGICNLNGYLNEEYFMNQHKKPHATMGKPNGGYNSKRR